MKGKKDREGREERNGREEKRRNQIVIIWHYHSIYMEKLRKSQDNSAKTARTTRDDNIMRVVLKLGGTRVHITSTCVTIASPICYFT
jgi:hypothetical protein